MLLFFYFKNILPRNVTSVRKRVLQLDAWLPNASEVTIFLVGYERNVFSSSWKTSGKFGDFIVCFLISVLFVQQIIVGFFSIVATGEAVRSVTSGLSEGEKTKSDLWKT